MMASKEVYDILAKLAANQTTMQDAQAKLNIQLAELVTAQQQTQQTLAKFIEAQTPVQNSSAQPSGLMNAGNRLASTFELLEKVLQDVDMETVFWAQSVNKPFRSTIVNSLPLQRKLFMAPALPDSITEPLLNPLLTKSSVCARLPLYLDQSVMCIAHCMRVGRKRLTPAIPSMTHWTRSPKGTISSLWLTWSLNAHVKANPTYSDDLVDVLGTGSWRKMYLTQAPCKLVFCVNGSSMEFASKMVNVAGTMDSVLEALAAPILEKKAKKAPRVISA